MQGKFKIIVFALIVMALCACGSKVNGINPTNQSGLDSTTAIAVYDLYSEGKDQILYLVNPDDIQKVVTALDANHPVTPKTFCAPRYQLEFELGDGKNVQFDYFCDGNDPFIRGDLDYFANEDYAVSGEFVTLMDGLLVTEGEAEDAAVGEDEYKPGSELANPASVYCEEQGGTIDMRTDASGGQYGVCQFDDGSECEDWAYFRGECEPGE